MRPLESAASGSRWDFRTDRTLVELLALNAAQRPSAIALREKDRGIWQQTTWSQWLEEVLCCAAGLEALGFGPGSGLVVLGDNRPHLYSGMLAAGALRGHAMPVYPDATPDEIRHVVEQSGATFVLAEDQEQVDKMLDLRESCPQLDHVLFDDPRGMGAYTDTGLLSWSALIASGQSRLQADPSLRTQLLQRARPDDVAVFIHSSGTTGKPKGVVLTHSNVLSGVANAYRAKAFDFGEEVLAYLPMAWIGDFAMTVGAGIGLHFTINIPESAETVLHNLREIAPTFYFNVPKGFEELLPFLRREPALRETFFSRLKAMLYAGAGMS
ncbi:MAG: AMP-binding protein, partial [Hylemonella sp.]